MNYEPWPGPCQSPDRQALFNPLDYGSGDFGSFRVLLGGHRPHYARVAHSIGVAGQFSSGKYRFGDVLAFIFEQEQKTPQVVHVRKLDTTIDQQCLYRFFGGLLGEKAQVLKIGLGNAVACEGEAASRSV